jgi:dephospho-CoA kinase
MLMVGLTGGIGAGKSAVAARLAALGAIVVDADVLAREAVAPGSEGLAEVVAAFGPGVLDRSGALDRAALGRRVFDDDAARRRLEAIVHPRVRAGTAELIAQAPPGSIVVNDVPLLVEAGLAAAFDVVLVVVADPRVRTERLMRHRGMTAAEAAARMAAQASDDERRAVADVVIVNDGTPAELMSQVDRVWHEFLVPRLTAKN